MTSQDEGGPRKGRPHKAATTPPVNRHHTPTVRPGVYTRLLPLRARHLGSVSWWLRDQPWCEEHLSNLAAAWSRVYGERAA
jgi:hypothetical protein